jgi:hypothetical protein
VQVQEAIGADAPPSGKYGYNSIMRAADFFFMVARASRDFGYYGHQVTANDARRVLAYWKRRGTEYEILWGDLRMETLAKDELIQRCRANGDSACLLDFLQKDDSASIEPLGEVGDASVVPALLERRDLWQGPPAANPFTQALVKIRRRLEQQDPARTLAAGRLLYANGRSVSQGFVRIGNTAGLTNFHGYFALLVPTEDPQASLPGYARQSTGASARLFFWSRTSRPAEPVVILDWADTVQGRVVDPQGKPWSDIEVGLSAQPGTSAGPVWPLGNRTRTDSQGTFLFELVPVGVPLEVSVGNPDSTSHFVRVGIDDLAPDQKYELGEIVLRRE